MSYTPKYSGDNASDAYANLKALTDYTLDSSTNPSESEVLNWIEEVETDIVERCLGNHTATDITFDVPERLEAVAPPISQIEGFEAYATGVYWYEAGILVLPPHRPLLQLTSIAKRTSALGSADAWSNYTVGRSGDVILLSYPRGSRTLGWGIYIFDDLPATGYQRLKATYDYGWNLPTAILREYCNLKLALKIFERLLRHHTPHGAGDFSVGDIRWSVEDIAGKQSTYYTRLEEIEERHFPRESTEIGIGIL